MSHWLWRRLKALSKTHSSGRPLVGEAMRARETERWLLFEWSVIGREREREKGKETDRASDGDRASEKKEGKLEKRERDGTSEVWSAGGLLDSLVYMRLHAVSVYNETRGKGRWGHCPIYSIFFFFFVPFFFQWLAWNLKDSFLKNFLYYNWKFSYYKEQKEYV